MSEKIKNDIINEEELNMAEDEAKSSTNEYVHKFEKPLLMRIKPMNSLLLIGADCPVTITCL